MQDTRTRRTFLTATGATAIGVALAGCAGSTAGSGAGGDGGDTPNGGGSTPTPTSTEGGSGGEWTEASTVEMTDGLKFAPKRIRVAAGTEVTWKNVGSIGHTVTAYEDEIPDGAAYFASGGFDSQQAAKDGYADGQGGNVPEGESYSHTFETKGTYEYYCIPHEMNGMAGYVKVV